MNQIILRNHSGQEHIVTLDTSAEILEVVIYNDKTFVRCNCFCYPFLMQHGNLRGHCRIPRGVIVPHGWLPVFKETIHVRVS